MSDGLSRIELKSAGYGSRYARSEEEGEQHGLLRTVPDRTVARLDGGSDDAGGDEAQPAAKPYDDKDLLPVMIENGLDKIGVL